MPGENMCRWITCATGKYAMVKRVPGEACATVNRGNICASGKQVPGENICRGNTCAMICTMRLMTQFLVFVSKVSTGITGRHVPWEDMCRGETCAGRNMCHGKPWEHMCLGKTGATGRHMPGENMCRWNTCATGKYAMVKRVPGEACATVNRGNTCASGKQVPWEKHMPWEHMCHDLYYETNKP
jgi:hypothetical protein